MSISPNGGGPAAEGARSLLILQAAAVLGVSRRTIYNRIRSGELETVRTVGGSQRVLMSSLQKALERQAGDEGHREQRHPASWPQTLERREDWRYRP